jgi:putative membrane-bound dehydrogenase-like protein
MKRALILAALGLAVLPLGWVGPPVYAQRPGRAQWIWFNEPDPAPPGTRYFRMVFRINRPVQQPVDEAILDLTATHSFTVWVNGKQVGKGNDWKKVRAFDVQKLLVHGSNVIAVEARHTKGPAGLLARLGYVPNGLSKLAVYSDGSWKASKTAAPGWQEVKFNDAGWAPVRVLGPYGSAGPAKALTWESGGDDRFSVPPGFRVEQAVKIPANDPRFSLVNMTFDNKGRLLVSREGGAVLLCTDPDKDGVFQTVKPYCTQVKNCQGMCWVKDALLLVGNGPQGAGLYRVRDTDGDDVTDQVQLLHRFRGGMGEHGPHAILHGPDDWLYVVTGNHAGAQIGADAATNGANPAKLAGNSPLTRWPTGGMGPDQGKPNTTEDVLLPRLNDARGHAADILAPGGTIWRIDHDGKNMSLVAAGFRNHFDAAFSPQGELFTFDSDMEWDEALPWYRAVRVCHCPPGADFVWRTGAANTPDYYIDSLPPIAETGRGSPVGLEFYDHHAYPEKYRGAYFMADWAIGVIFAVHLERDGASYKAKVERFCSGAPMNVTDLAVGPDGAIYFVMGGRGTQGGVYRIVHTGKRNLPDPRTVAVQARLLDPPQPLAAWSRARQAELLAGLKGQAGLPKPQEVAFELASVAKNDKARPADRVRALDYLARHDRVRLRTLLPGLATEDLYADVRAHAVWILGFMGDQKSSRGPLLNALKDNDAMVRRRACEALVRVGIEPPVETVWPLLGDKDRFVRHAARLVLERIDPAIWAGRIGKEKSDRIAWNGIIALCHMNRAAPEAEGIFRRLRGARGLQEATPQQQLDYLRTVQMALIHTSKRPVGVEGIAHQCAKLFPHKDGRVNRELAILLTAFQREKFLGPVQAKLVKALLASKGDRQQQIHYFYCLRLLKDGWTPEQKTRLAAWYDSTRDWRGGHSFTPFLENIFRETLGAYTAADRQEILQHGPAQPLATLVLAQRLQTDSQPELLPDLGRLRERLQKEKLTYRPDELRRAVEDALTRTAVRNPTPENFPFLVDSLRSKNPITRGDALRALGKLNAKPKPEDPAPFRTLLQAAAELRGPAQRWEAVQLLRQWTGRSFGGSKATADRELKNWARWFGQSFPKEPPLPDVAAEKEPPSKYRFDELLTYLESPQGKGDPAGGRLVFEKAQCIKCHKYGAVGEGIGPDLTALSKRFKRRDTLESIIYPSKVISDQYRSTTVTTVNGQQLTGLVAVQGDTVSVVLNDASKVTLKRNEVESQVASLISVMPERLLDTLTRREIADLFAYLESEPK